MIFTECRTQTDEVFRPECLDHILVFGENHLFRSMKTYVDTYNNARTHLFLGKDAPARREISS